MRPCVIFAFMSISTIYTQDIIWSDYNGTVDEYVLWLNCCDDETCTAPPERCRSEVTREFPGAPYCAEGNCLHFNAGTMGTSYAQLKKNVDATLYTSLWLNFAYYTDAADREGNRVCQIAYSCNNGGWRDHILTEALKYTHVSLDATECDQSWLNLRFRCRGGDVTDDSTLRAQAYLDDIEVIGTQIPTPNPTKSPTSNPSKTPTNLPSVSPTATPSEIPSNDPSSDPTAVPSSPTTKPTVFPSVAPSYSPSFPTDYPSQFPTVFLRDAAVDDGITTHSTYFDASHELGSDQSTQSNTIAMLIIYIICGIVIGGVCIAAMCLAGFYGYLRKQKAAINANNIVELVDTSHVTPTMHHTNTTKDMNTIGVNARMPCDQTNNAGVEVKYEDAALVNWFENVVQLPQYTDIFVSNGYDKLMRLTTIKAISQLENIGVIWKSHQAIIMQGIQKLRNDLMVIKGEMYGGNETNDVWKEDQVNLEGVEATTEGPTKEQDHSQSSCESLFENSVQLEMRMRSETAGSDPTAGGDPTPGINKY